MARARSFLVGASFVSLVLAGAIPSSAQETGAGAGGQTPFAPSSPPAAGQPSNGAGAGAGTGAGKPAGQSAERKVPALPAPPVANPPTKLNTETSKPRPKIAPRPGAGEGPQSVADLAEGLLDAVVNISSSQKVDPSDSNAPELQAPEGSPLQDFFDDLDKNKNGSEGRHVESLGSGFVIDPSGVIVTNNHVIADADEITVNFADGKQLEAKLLGTDTKTDLAVLKVTSDKPLPSVQFGNSDKLRIGDWVMAIGNPFGLGGSVSIGIVSARGRNINAGPYDNFIQTDAAINRGNSGGPLFDLNGDVVGINTAIISPSGGSIGIGFSIPSKLAINVVNQLREYGETRRGWLGVRLQAVDDDIAAGLGLSQTKGAVVMGVIPGSPSDNGKLKVGDVITRFDGQPVEGSHDLPRIVAETPVGKDVEVDILRKDKPDQAAKQQKVTITLGRLEDGEEMMAKNEDANAKKAEGGESAGKTGDGGADDDKDKSEAEARAERTVLGMSLAPLDAASRKRFDLKEDAEGVVVTAVDENSAAAEKGIAAGTLIRQIAQESVSTPSGVVEKIAALKKEGRRNALVLLATANGDLRFVVVPID